MSRYTTLVIVATFLFGFFALFKAPGDPDFGWHYKYGEYIVQHGRILRDNTFSYTFTDYKWANSYWISQVLMFIAHNSFGHLWAGVLFSAILSLVVIWYTKILGKRLNSGFILTALVAIFLIIELSGTGVTGRPMYFSSIFLMFLTVLLLADKNSARLWILPVLFLVWANTHADFTLGLFIFGLYVLDVMGVAGFSVGPLNPALKIVRKWFWRGEAERAEATDRNSKQALASAPAKSLPRLYIIALLSVAVTAINPYGLHLWETLIKESHPYQFKHIIEWVPVTTENMVQFITYCAVLGLLTSALVGARQKLPGWYMLAVGVFCILAVRSQYFLRIAVVLGSYAVLAFWTPYARDIASALTPKVVKKLKLGFMLFMFLSTFIVFAVFLDEAKQSTDRTYWLRKQSYPGKALDWALANNITGNVFNYYGWGGYMIWQYPQIKTFVDGRMPSWREDGKSVFEDYISVVDNPAKSTHILDDYNITWVLYPVGSAESKFLDFLTASPTWRQVYSDDTAVLFVRN